jgi:hypothetical protein
MCEMSVRTSLKSAMEAASFRVGIHCSEVTTVLRDMTVGKS